MTFRLRTLLVLTAILGAALLPAAARISENRSALAAVRRLGGAWTNVPTPPHVARWIPVSIARELWPRRRDCACEVDVRDERRQFYDSDFRDARSLAHLQILRVPGRGITDAAVAEIASLREITELGLGDTVITDEGLRMIATMTSLEWLALSSPRISDAGLEHIATLPRLKSLFISAPQVTDRAAAILARAKTLTYLKLESPKFTTVGGATFRRLAPSVDAWPRDVFPPQAGSLPTAF